MIARVTIGGEVKLPDEVMKALDLAPGSEVAFERGAGGEIVLSKAQVERPTPVDYRARLVEATERLRTDVSPEYRGMSTDEFMRLLRSD